MKDEARLRSLALAGIVGPVVFVSSWVVAGLRRDGYDPTEDAISRLAELGAPERWIVTTGIAAFGAACVLMALVLRDRWSAARTSSALLAAGLMSFAVALFPCSEGCPGEGSFTDIAHSIAAGGHYIALVLAAVAIRWEPSAPSSWGSASLGCAVLGGTALLLHGTGVGPNGLLQRVGLSVLDLWMMGTAVLVLLSAPTRAGTARSRGTDP